MRLLLLSLSLLLPLGVTAREKYAILVQTVAPHQVRDFRRLLLERFGFPRQYVITLAKDKLALEGLTEEMVLAPPRPEYIKFYLEWAVRRLKPEDMLVVLACVHTRAPFFIEAALPHWEVDKILSLAPKDVTVVVIIEGCQSGAAIKFLNHADVVYTSTDEKELCFGGFIHLFIDALGRNPSAMREADLNKDGKVTLGEAFEYASERERLERFYKSIPKEFWPFDWAPHPQKKGHEPGLKLYLGD